jgi:hypothetical protein
MGTIARRQEGLGVGTATTIIKDRQHTISTTQQGDHGCDTRLLQLRDTPDSWQRSYTGADSTSFYRGPVPSSSRSKAMSSHSNATWGSASHVSSVPKPTNMSPPSRTSASRVPVHTTPPSRETQDRDISSSGRVVSQPCPWTTPWCMWCNRIPPPLRWCKVSACRGLGNDHHTTQYNAREPHLRL